MLDSLVYPIYFHNIIIVTLQLSPSTGLWPSVPFKGGQICPGWAKEGLQDIFLNS